MGMRFELLLQLSRRHDHGSDKLLVDDADGTDAVIVSWPLLADGWVLEHTNALPTAAGAAWPQVPAPYQTNGAWRFVTFTNTPATGSQFFRLHKP